MCPFNEVFTIFIIIEYLSALYSSDYDMMQEAGCIKSGHPRHAPNILLYSLDVKLFDYLRTSEQPTRLQSSW